MNILSKGLKMKRIILALLLCLSFAAPSFGAVLKQRGDTAANWTSNNPTLAAREVGWETDTKKFKLGDGSTAWTSLGYVGGSSVTIISGTSTLGTASIASGACATTVTTTATGAATTDVISGNFNSSPLAVTGYAASASGGLFIYAWPTANNVNFSVCNDTAAPITPGARTLNWQIIK